MFNKKEYNKKYQKTHREENKKYRLINKQKYIEADKRWKDSLSEDYRYTLVSYHAMKQRCYDKNHSNYPRYGGIGIIVCERWKKSFKNFIFDMGLKPAKGWCIDRINNNGNYEPSTIRWLSLLDSLKNKKNRIN